MDNNGVEFRNQLYASIHDRVTAAIEAKKQEIAGNLIRQEAKEAEKEDEDEEGSKHEKSEKKMMKSLDKNGDGKHTMADHKKESVELDEEEKDEKEEKPSSKRPSSLGVHFGRKSSSGGKTTETKTGRVHTSGDRY